MFSLRELLLKEFLTSLAAHMLPRLYGGGRNRGKEKEIDWMDRMPCSLTNSMPLA
jgi:hypothetical protein